MPQRLVLGCWVSPRGLHKCKHYLLLEEHSASWASISHLLPGNSDGLTRRYAGLLDSPHAVLVQSRRTGRCSTVLGLTPRQCFKDACSTALNLSSDPSLPLPSSARGEPFRRSSAAADWKRVLLTARAQSTGAMARSPGSLHAAAPPPAPQHKDDSAQWSGTGRLQTLQAPSPDESAELQGFTLLPACFVARSPMSSN